MDLSRERLVANLKFLINYIQTYIIMKKLTTLLRILLLSLEETTTSVLAIYLQPTLIGASILSHIKWSCIPFRLSVSVRNRRGEGEMTFSTLLKEFKIFASLLLQPPIRGSTYP
jgi:hypothetical protein